MWEAKTSASPEQRLNHTGFTLARQLRRPQEGIIKIQHQGGVFRQAIADLQLCLTDVLLAAQIADMGGADAGDKAHIRTGAAGQTADLPRMVHAHLHHRVFGVRPDAEQGAGQAQLIILVALGLDGFAASSQSCVAHLFCGGLAHAACDSHHLWVIGIAVVGAQGHHGLIAVRAKDGLFRRDCLHRVVQHHSQGAFFQRCCRKVMPGQNSRREMPTKMHPDIPAGCRS